jgi:hypothetical protein
MSTTVSTPASNTTPLVHGLEPQSPEEQERRAAATEARRRRRLLLTRRQNSGSSRRSSVSYFGSLAMCPNV